MTDPISARAFGAPSDGLECPSSSPDPALASRQLRQGDVFLDPVEEIPEAARVVPRHQGAVILARGEATGHAHAIRSAGATLLREGNGAFLRVVMGVRLEHEEHAGLDVPPGLYRVVVQREYVPAPVGSTAWRRVAD